MSAAPAEQPEPAGLVVPPELLAWKRRLLRVLAEGAIEVWDDELVARASAVTAECNAEIAAEVQP